MKRFGLIAAFAFGCAASIAQAKPLALTTAQDARLHQAQVFVPGNPPQAYPQAPTRFNNRYLLLEKRPNRSRQQSGMPRCRRGLFGRIVNKTKCKGRRRHGSIGNGRRY